MRNASFRLFLSATVICASVLCPTTVDAARYPTRHRAQRFFDVRPPDGAASSRRAAQQSSAGDRHSGDARPRCLLDV